MQKHNLSSQWMPKIEHQPIILSLEERAVSRCSL